MGSLSVKMGIISDIIVVILKVFFIVIVFSINFKKVVLLLFIKILVGWWLNIKNVEDIFIKAAVIYVEIFVVDIMFRFISVIKNRVVLEIVVILAVSLFILLIKFIIVVILKS